MRPASTAAMLASSFGISPSVTRESSSSRIRRAAVNASLVISTLRRAASNRPASTRTDAASSRSRSCTDSVVASTACCAVLMRAGRRNRSSGHSTSTSVWCCSPVISMRLADNVGFGLKPACVSWPPATVIAARAARMSGDRSSAVATSCSIVPSCAKPFAG